tara:strand:+ start:195 stop:563 length:369 start_codon:yes stop_codon:yes gene_type:complete
MIEKIHTDSNGNQTGNCAEAHYLSECARLQAELDAAEAKAFIMQDVLNFFISTAQTPDAYKEMARDVLMKTPAQSLAKVQADTITKLIADKSEEASIDGCLWNVICVGEAEKVINELLGGGE